MIVYLIVAGVATGIAYGNSTLKNRDPVGWMVLCALVPLAVLVLLSMPALPADAEDCE